MTKTDISKVFSNRTDLQEYGTNARLLFALELKFHTEDIETVATNSLVDGPDDCKCDLIFVDKDSGIAVIAQGYESTKTARASAPSNKADDLNTAASWLLARAIEDIPQQIRSATIELRDAIKNGVVEQLQFWYVHNLPESQNVRNSLKTVESSAQSLLQKNFPNSSITVTALEIGVDVLRQWYENLRTPILVSDSIKVQIDSGYEFEGDDWSAFVTAVPASWLRKLHLAHKDELFSANLRGYLGSNKKKTNINNAIKTTAEDHPGYFWVFNNGITGIVNGYKVKGKTLELSGLSIVNGAQTTGAIGALKDSPDDAFVQARFIKCTDQKIIDQIIKFNNSQNPVEPSDFRSNDQTQKRLRDEFKSIPDCKYQGGRRGGHEDVIRRQPNLIPSNTAAQALAAFHNNPVGAYNEKSQIWLSDDLYSKYFGDETHADHIVFAYSLLRCVQHKRTILMQKSRTGATLRQTEKEELEFLRKRGAIFLLVAAISDCIETFLDQAVPNTYRLHFDGDVSPQIGQGYWEPIVDAMLPLSSHLSPAIAGALNNSEEANRAIVTFRTLVGSIRGSLAKEFEQFASKVRSRT